MRKSSFWKCLPYSNAFYIALFTLQLSTQVQPTLVYPALTAKYSVNASWVEPRLVTSSMQLVFNDAIELEYFGACFEFSPSFVQKYESIQLPLAAFAQFSELQAVFMHESIKTSHPPMLQSISLLYRFPILSCYLSFTYYLCFAT